MKTPFEQACEAVTKAYREDSSPLAAAAHQVMTGAAHARQQLMMQRDQAVAETARVAKERDQAVAAAERWKQQLRELGEEMLRLTTVAAELAQARAEQERAAGQVRKQAEVLLRLADRMTP